MWIRRKGSKNRIHTGIENYEKPFSPVIWFQCLWLTCLYSQPITRGVTYYIFNISTVFECFKRLHKIWFPHFIQPFFFIFRREERGRGVVREKVKMACYSHAAVKPSTRSYGLPTAPLPPVWPGCLWTGKGKTKWQSKWSTLLRFCSPCSSGKSPRGSAQPFDGAQCILGQFLLRRLFCQRILATGLKHAATMTPSWSWEN